MDQKKHRTISRRNFIKTSAAAGAAVMFSATPLVASATRADKKRYAIVGMGIRSKMFQGAILGDYAPYAQLVGICDVNAGRLRLAQKEVRESANLEIPAFTAEEFDKMVKDTHPDVIIVTTVDSVHDTHIIRAMELGCDVITEKPMTTDHEKCQTIIDTQKKTGKSLLVTFNYRYSPPRSQVKDILMSGEIGEVLSVDFHWMLNTYHGADYFRRWHSLKKYSGGLMIHKATHHFDLVNWWLSAIPVTVYANGKREFYTPQMAKRFGLISHHERCHNCPEKDKCAFELSLARNDSLKKLYLDNEQYDGYFRDRCVFRPEIDIEDTMNVIVRYDNQVTLSYSLNAFNSWEGYYIVFNGTKGRVEHEIQEKIYVSGTDTEQGGLKEGGTTTRVIPLRGTVKEYTPWSGEGGHGGGDKLMLDDIFLPNKKEDKYKRAADFRSGAYSILTGVAANLSMADNQIIQIADIIKNLDYPDYTAMPSRTAPLAMPAK
jgi:predicted dehydrogenase